MKQDALFSGYTPTADLTAKASYCRGKRGLQPLAVTLRVLSSDAPYEVNDPPSTFAQPLVACTLSGFIRLPLAGHTNAPLNSGQP